MVPPRMQRRVEEAAESVRGIVRPPPARSAAPRRAGLDRSISAAMASLQTLTDFSLSSRPDEMTAHGMRYAHETPSRLFRGIDDARRHSRGAADSFAAILAERGEGPGLAARRRAIAPVDTGLRAANAALSIAIASGWLTDSYLGGIVGPRFRGSPPIVTTESEGFFELHDEVFALHDTRGIYFPGTSHIAVIARTMPEADRRRIIAHEQLHYAAWLGGGHSIRWSRGGGRETVLGRVSWLHEGLTELHAQQLTREHGHTPTGVSYQMETAVGYYLQRLVGPERLRRAYLTGDFSQVRGIVDRRLGRGAFEMLARQPNGYSALVFMRARLRAAGIDYSAWRSPLADVPLLSATDERGTGNR